MNVYKWRGHTYQIADEDLPLYPGAELVEPEKKAIKEEPKNKKRTAKNKSAAKKEG